MVNSGEYQQSGAVGSHDHSPVSRTTEVLTMNNVSKYAVPDNPNDDDNDPDNPTT
jgi:hypothetical protein